MCISVIYSKECNLEASNSIRSEYKMALWTSSEVERGCPGWFSKVGLETSGYRMHCMREDC